MSALTKAQGEELKLLRGAAAVTLPRTISQDSAEFSYDALRKLCEDGMMTAREFVPISGPKDSTDPRITSRGKDRLAELEQLARHWSARAVSALVVFYLRRWPWLWGTAIVIALGIWKG